MDIKPLPKKRPEVTTESPLVSIPQPPQPTDSTKRSNRPPLKVLIPLLGAILIVLLAISSTFWYNWALEAPSDDTRQVRVVVEPGETAATIAVTLRDHGLIKSRAAFNIYIQLSGARSKLQAGGYVLSPNEDVQTIVGHMTSGKTDEFNITIPPGLTLDELHDHFKRDGFSEEEIAAAFGASFDHELLQTRPVGASLEGYIYPETYRMNADQSLQALFDRSFDELYAVLQDNKYLEAFASRNLTIHQGLTLASIVQKEVKEPSDQKQVAQVFLSRLGRGMHLGSDVTYMYAAKQIGVEGSPSLDSPYNTRKYVGLPPGPIANMNPSALAAVAAPAPGDFLYFVAGDDGVTYFARTEAEHEANVSAHCTTLCQ